MEKVVRKTSASGKAKASNKTVAKKVKRPTRGATAAKRAVQSATHNATGATKTAARQWNNGAEVSSAAMKSGAKAMQGFMKNGAADVQKKMMSMMGQSMMGGEGVAQFAKTADKASRSVGELVAISRDNVEACVACSNIAVNASKHMGAELFSFANKSFSQNVEMSKELLACRTLNDMFDLQSRVMKANLDNFFSESVKMSEFIFDCATQVSEPLNERVSDTAHRISRTLSDAA